MHSKLSTVEIKPRSDHRYSIIWLHGLGADGHDFEGIVPELRLTAADHIHFIFPDAPVRAVTINSGMKMRAWYDISDMSLERVDFAGIAHSEESVGRLIHDEMEKGIPSCRIMLAGFSQGGVIALHAGLRYPETLGGIIALSSYLPTIGQLKAERSAANCRTPIFMAHGIVDSVVAVEQGQMACNALKEMNYPVEWHDFVMDHAVCADEIERISDFINLNFQQGRQ